jgi:ZIP family zinc transporter
MLLAPTSIAILLLSLLSLVTTTAGVALALLIRENIPAIAAGIGFSTGIMVLVSVAELVPAAQALVGTAGVATMVFLGGAFLGLANFAIPHGHLVTEHGLSDTRLIRSAYMVVAGLILHDVPEGFAMANAYIASPSLGLLVAKRHHTSQSALP